MGPWSRWQGNLDAELLIVGQDWGDTGYFGRNDGWEDSQNPTDTTLVELLREIGIAISRPGRAGTSVVFLTNAILCLKHGGLQAKVRARWFTNCQPHLRRVIELVQPKVVIGLGSGRTA